MIQRIQTLFLLGVAILMGMTNAYYIWGEQSVDQETVVTLTSMKLKVIDTAGTISNLSDDTLIREDATWYIGALTIVAALIAIFSALQFKNRLNQMKWVI